MASEKDTIYVDVDDEITAVIDKVKSSKSKLVALVLPKRATVFQSIVNMKLLKKAADSSSKHLVLITTEAGLLPLAGASGIYVAKTLTSKPEIPSSPDDEGPDEEIDETDQPAVDKSSSVGELSAAAVAGGAAVAAANKEDEPETLSIDNTAKDKPSPSDAKPSRAKAKKDKNLKVPNFERFRKYLLIGAAALIVLIILFFVFSSTFAKASISISTDGENLSTSQNLNLSTQATSVDVSSQTVPAKVTTEQKTYSQEVTTTGQQNHGNKATGTVNLTEQVCGAGEAPDLPAGSGLSNNNQTYITSETTQFNNLPNGHKGGCFTYPASDATSIQAQNAGAAYNVSGVTFSTTNGGNGVSGSGSASGGTDNIVQTVNENDINNAKNKITANNDSAKNDLIKQIKGQKLYPVQATFSTGTPKVTSSANVGDVANNVTVTETITYSMFGVNKNDLSAILENSINGQIDPSKQAILNNGIDKATFNVSSQTDSSAQLAMSTTAEIGPHLDITAIKRSSAGKKSGDIRTEIMKNPDVTNVKVRIAPFWSSTVPSNTNKITIKIAKPTTYKTST